MSVFAYFRRELPDKLSDDLMPAVFPTHALTLSAKEAKRPSASKWHHGYHASPPTSVGTKLILLSIAASLLGIYAKSVHAPYIGEASFATSAVALIAGIYYSFRR